jgi:hypothetical protein
MGLLKVKRLPWVAEGDRTQKLLKYLRNTWDEEEILTPNSC